MSKNKNDKNVIYMKSDDFAINLKDERTPSYYKTSKFDKSLLNTPGTWHLIIVNHKNRYKKDEILKAFYEIIGDDEFYPVAYREYSSCDKFLIRQHRTAIQKLFQKNLILDMKDTGNVELTFKFNVANYEPGQIYPAKRVEKAIEKQFKKLKKIENVDNLLNLDNFNNHFELADIFIYLGNKAAFDLVCKIIFQNHEILNEINGIILSNNNITSLASLEKFEGITIKLIDLSYNNIKTISQFKVLKSLSVENLFVEGNPVVHITGYEQHILHMLPTVVRLCNFKKQISTSSHDATEGLRAIYEGELITQSINSFHKKYSLFDMWNEVIIKKENNVTKENIIIALFKICELYPCYYQIGEKEDKFYVRKSISEMEKLMKKYNMKLKIINSDEHVYLPITFRMNIANYLEGQVDPDKIIGTALLERFNLMDKSLNLENFCEMPILSNIGLTFASSEILSSVLRKCGKKFENNFFNLYLGKNNIKSCKGLSSLVWLKNLKFLDLSNNSIKSIVDLKNIPKTSIKELHLNGNPLCKNFNFPNDYIEEVKNLFPDLEKLDGVELNSDHMLVHKNYLCVVEGYDFVQKFVEKYFKIYDSEERINLIDMYDDNASISLSFNFDAKKINSNNSDRIKIYFNLSRNIRTMKDLSRAYRSSYIGKDDIKTMLKSLPKTAHDFYSFTTDLTYFDRKTACLTITGVFQDEIDVMDIELKFSFTRTFILKAKNFHLGITKNLVEYKIVNDILYVSYVTPLQFKNSFKYSLPDNIPTFEAVKSEDKECFTIMFQSMTNLKTVWCTMCFDEVNWNFKKALEIFLDKVAKNQIPESAFF